LNQTDPAQNQRAHDPLAQIRLGDDQRAQLRRRHQKRFNVFVGMRIDHRRQTGELTYLGPGTARAFGARPGRRGQGRRAG